MTARVISGGGFEVALTLHGRPQDRNLPFIAHLINGDLIGFCRAVVEGTWHPGLRAALQRLVFPPNGEGAKSMWEWIETAKTESAFLLNPWVARSLSGNDIDIASFGSFPQTLYIHGPLDVPETCVPLNKLLLGASIGQLFRGDAPRDIPIVLFCDETLAFCDGLQDLLLRSYAAARKYNVSLYCSFTSLSELQVVFEGRKGDALISNAGLLQFLDAVDPAGSDFVSNKLLGDVEVYGYTKQVSAPISWRGVPPLAGNVPEMRIQNVSNEATIARDLKVSHTYEKQRRPLMTVFDVRNMPLTDTIAVVREIPAPLRLRKVPFWETSLKSRAKPNPFVRSRG